MHLLSHPGRSTLASGSQAASQEGRSRSFWPPPGGRRRRTRPGSARRPCQSPTAPFKHKAGGQRLGCSDKPSGCQDVFCVFLCGDPQTFDLLYLPHDDQLFHLMK